VPLSPLYEGLGALADAAKEYEIPGLIALTAALQGSAVARAIAKRGGGAKAVAALRPDGKVDSDDSDAEAEEEDDEAEEDEAARDAAAADAAFEAERGGLSSVRRLPVDMAGLLDSGRWADVTFVAEGVRVAAHRFVLCARSDYFRAMFARGLSTTSGTLVALDRVTVEVPDRLGSLRRLLTYLYTGIVVACSNEALLEDLVAADRYGIAPLKTACESAIAVGAPSAARVFELSHLVAAWRLRQSALCCVLHELAEVSTTPHFARLQANNPALMGELLAKLQERSEMAFGELEEDVPEVEERKEEDDFTKGQKFPWGSLVLLIIAGSMYWATQHHGDSTGWVVPTLNAIVLAAVVIYACLSMRQ